MALAEAEKICLERGLRLTDIRRNVLEALYATHRPLGAYDLIERLAEKGLKRLAPVTIYRALDFLMENGFAHKLASRNAFVACPFHHRADEVVVFLICEECGGVDETVSDELTDALAAIVKRERFKQQSRVIEIVGACAHCRGSEAGRA